MDHCASKKEKKMRSLLKQPAFVVSMAEDDATGIEMQRLVDAAPSVPQSASSPTEDKTSTTAATVKVADEDVCKECKRPRKNMTLHTTSEVCTKEAPACMMECCCCCNQACREWLEVLRRLPRSDYAMLIFLIFTLSAWVLFLLGMRAAIRAHDSTAHYQWYHWIPILMQSFALLFFLGIHYPRADDMPLSLQSTGQEEADRCMRNLRMTCIIALTVGGFLLSMMLASWSWYDPDTYVPATSPPPATTTAAKTTPPPSTTPRVTVSPEWQTAPGSFLIMSALCMLLGVFFRWMSSALYARELAHDELSL